MSISRLSVSNLRNLRSVNLEFATDINLFIGKNGSGKTSLLESIYLLGLARSFRSTKLKPIINSQSQECTVFAELSVGRNRKLPLGLKRSLSGELMIRYAGEKVRTVAQLAQLLPIQVINPDTFQLLEGGPKLRRQFLDWGVFHVEHLYMEHWRQAQKCIKHRNSLLRRDKISPTELKVWSESLANLASKIDQQRQLYIDQFVPVFNEIVSQLIDLPDLSLSYYSGWDKKVELLDLLTSNFDKEQNQHRTLYGPHRADLKVKVDGLPADEILSRGQLKLVTAALKIAQGFLFNKFTNQQSIYLIDDIAAELDNEKKNKLCQLIEAMNCQAFITCVEESSLDYEWHETKDVKMFHVEHGQIKPVDRADKG
ncbi:DNA replication/repair protein RecF [Endozoicomonas sp. SM1973]|uniref:DNA replication and repair protein RecF n=1 Tax=Spartinivicinus marinus TaxID=2994442 RepID=A0A853HYI0_9GAMM|nr:DNA replication/repair protein RecF [Spartinivicinus marinus]MCX4026854.1 DNA replication/repair protein RecF [Spartinivicinus marinus]NYZ66800.1 DNA replication/repair protein RecF [Spartinivicinus marinus]